MSASRLVLKQKTGWFAAGRELQDALRLLSDSAFKLYVWLCLNADRRLGAIRVDADKVAPVLGVEIRWIDAGLAELRESGVCRTNGQEIEIAFHHFLRPEAKFDSVEALVAQMDTDCAEAQRLLASR